MVGPTDSYPKVNIVLYFESLGMARLRLSEQNLSYASLLYTTPPYPSLPFGIIILDRVVVSVFYKRLNRAGNITFL